MWTKSLPIVNASLNATAGILLFLGWVAIKRGRRDIHKRLMITALGVSTLFLCSYLTYHYFEGVHKYQGQGVWRPIYFFILGTHTPLAIVIVPVCLIAVYHAVKGNFKKHTRLTRWLYPTWMYVSVTGVIIYFMLYVF